MILLNSSSELHYGLRDPSCRVMDVLYVTLHDDVKWAASSSARAKIAHVCSRTHGGRRCEFRMTVTAATSMRRTFSGQQPRKLQKRWRNGVYVLLLHRAGETQVHTHAGAPCGLNGYSVRHREIFAEINFFVGNKFMGVFGCLPR
jgi:hypothetical protein